MSKVVIDLWEDNAGGLYLHPEGADIVYAGVEQAGSAFAADAAEMAASGGEYPASWDVEACSPSVLAHDEARIVASWEDGKISLQADAVRGGAPGRAAREYLGLSNDAMSKPAAQTSLSGCRRTVITGDQTPISSTS